MSLWRFFLFSESTALSSRSSVSSKNKGAMKNWPNRSRAPYKGDSSFETGSGWVPFSGAPLSDGVDEEAASSK